MKKQFIEPDFIGSQEPLTKEEEAALTAYFAEKKHQTSKAVRPPLPKAKNATSA